MYCLKNAFFFVGLALITFSLDAAEISAADLPITVDLAISGSTDKSMDVRGYLEDFQTFKRILAENKPIKDIQNRLAKNRLILTVAVGNKSQVRLGATFLFNKLAENIDIAKQFYSIQENDQKLQNALMRIKNYKGTDKLFDDFVMVEKKPEDESKVLTASMQDTSLVLAMAELDDAIVEAEKALNTVDLNQSSISSASAATTLSHLPVPNVSVAPVLIRDPIVDRIQMILSWPDHAKKEKVAALQLLAAYEYNQASGEEQRGLMVGRKSDVAPTNKFLGSLRIFHALYRLGASIPSVRQEERQKYYKIESFGLVSEKQLKDYMSKGRGDLLRGLCASLNKNMKMTLEKFWNEPTKLSKQKAIKLANRYRQTLNICSYMQEKSETEKFKNILKQYEIWLERGERVQVQLKTFRERFNSIKKQLDAIKTVGDLNAKIKDINSQLEVIEKDIRDSGLSERGQAGLLIELGKLYAQKYPLEGRANAIENAFKKYDPEITTMTTPSPVDVYAAQENYRAIPSYVDNYSYAIEQGDLPLIEKRQPLIQKKQVDNQTWGARLRSLFSGGKEATTKSAKPGTVAMQPVVPVVKRQKLSKISAESMMKEYQPNKRAQSPNPFVRFANWLNLYR